MGERKVLNKYIPADFDPSLVPRGKKLSTKDGTVPVRMMLPFTLQCSTCHTFNYRGRKYNSKKEPMGGPDGKYLGIQRFRFYIKCTHCSRTLSFLTDPKNADYEMESGGTRNYEINKDRRKTEEEAAQVKEEEEKIDPMKALENRVLDSQREMADLDNLEEIKAMNKRHLQLLSATGEGFGSDAKAVFESREAREKKAHIAELNENGITEDDENLIKSIQFGQKQPTVVRLNDDDEKIEEARRQQELRTIQDRQREKAVAAKPAVPLVKVKRKKKPIKNEKAKKAKVGKEATPPPPPPAVGMSDLLGGYGSDSD